MAPPKKEVPVNNDLIEVGFCELHKPLFLGGRNLKDRLDCLQQAGLKMQYDRKEKELIVEWNKKTAYIPSTNVAYYIAGPGYDRKVHQNAAPFVAHVGSAQVETPMSHVHAGHGHGKTGQTIK